MEVKKAFKATEIPGNVSRTLRLEEGESTCVNDAYKLRVG